MTLMVAVSSGMVRVVVPEVSLSRISLQPMTCVLDDKSYTYYSPGVGSFASIGLSFCRPSLFLGYNWSVFEDQHGSCHFPFVIGRFFSTGDHDPGWKLGGAGWGPFGALCIGGAVVVRGVFCS